MEVFRTASLGSNFNGCHKKYCRALCQNKFLLIPLIGYNGNSLSYSTTHQSH